jgi:hypothetical protein
MSLTLKTFAQFPQLFRSADDATWQEWLAFDGRNSHSLIDLTKDPQISPCFKARALSPLIVPICSWSPACPRTGSEAGHNPFREVTTLGELPDPLIDFASALVVECADRLASRRHGMIRNPLGAERILQGYLLQLLGRVPYAEGEPIFTYFELNAVKPHYALQSNSGFDMFRALMFASDVDERWKRRADARLRTVILVEEADECDPRARSETAVNRYERLLISYLECQEPPYSRDFYADQWTFLAVLSRSRVFMASVYPAKLFELFSGPHHVGLRGWIARSAFLSDEPFQVSLGETLRFAEAVVAELATANTANVEIATAAQRAIDAARVRLDEERSASLRHQQTRQRLIERMSA